MKILKHRKGQGLSLNTIVIAMLVMIVLLVLILVFTGRLGIFSDILGKSDVSCIGKGGKWCGASASCTEVDGVTEDAPSGKAYCCPITYYDADNPC